MGKPEKFYIILRQSRTNVPSFPSYPRLFRRIRRGGAAVEIKKTGGFLICWGKKDVAAPAASAKLEINMISKNNRVHIPHRRRRKENGGNEVSRD